MADKIEIGERAAVVQEARSWLGTPYHNCADIKGVGVDCGMLLVRVFVDTGLIPPFDPRPYAPDWHLHRGEEKYLGFIFDNGAEVREPQPGDVMVFRYGRCYSHGGIVTEVGSRKSEIGNQKSETGRLLRAPCARIVHAYYEARCVVEDDAWRSGPLSDPARKPRFFSLWASPGSQKSEIGNRNEQAAALPISDF